MESSSRKNPMRTLTRWQPHRDFEIMRRQFDRMFDDMARLNLDAVFAQPQSQSWMPAVELQDVGNALIVRAELPGIEAKDLDVQVGRDAVLIKGEYRAEQKTETNGRVRSEFRYGQFQRVIPLQVPVHNDQVQAELKDGILTLTLPKANTVVKLNLGGSNSVEAIAPEAAPVSEPALSEPELSEASAPVEAITSELSAGPTVVGDVWSEEAAA